jgi:hypothetical protein
MYILPDGTVIRFDQSIGKIDLSHLIPYIGQETKVLYLPSEDPTVTGDAEVEMKIIKWANKGHITFE